MSLYHERARVASLSRLLPADHPDLIRARSVLVTKRALRDYARARANLLAATGIEAPDAAGMLGLTFGITHHEDER